VFYVQLHKLLQSYIHLGLTFEPMHILNNRRCDSEGAGVLQLCPVRYRGNPVIIGKKVQLLHGISLSGTFPVSARDQTSITEKILEIFSSLAVGLIWSFDFHYLTV